MESVGIIAGSGTFPRLVAQSLRTSGKRAVICGFTGHTDPELAADADAFTLLPLGQLGKLIAFFREQGVSDLCMAGAISKPKALDLRPDLRVMKLLFSLRHKGDDAILRTLAEELGREGFRVIQASALVPDLAAPCGVLTDRSPDADIWADIRFGWPIARDLGRYDIGQALVVKSGIVVAVEAMEGTDAAIERGGQLGGAGCVLIKILKPGQDRRLDQPAIGLQTVERLCRYKYAALAFQAGTTLFFDREEALALACKHKLCIVGIDEAGP